MIPMRPLFALTAFLSIAFVSSAAMAAASLTGIKLQPVYEKGDATGSKEAWSTNAEDNLAPLGVVLNEEFQNDGTELPPLGAIDIPLNPGIYILTLLGNGTYPNNEYYGCTLSFTDSVETTQVEVFNANGSLEVPLRVPVRVPEALPFYTARDGTKVTVLGFALSSLITPVETDQIPSIPDSPDTTGQLVLMVAKESRISDTVTLSNGYRVDFLGVTYNEDGTSTWEYSISELPSAQDLSNWVLEIPDTASVISASPDNYELVHPDPNARLDGIKWQTGGGFEKGVFSVVVEGHWAMGTVQVAAKGPDVAWGVISGPGDEEVVPINAYKSLKRKHSRLESKHERLIKKYQMLQKSYEKLRRKLARLR